MKEIKAKPGSFGALDIKWRTPTSDGSISVNQHNLTSLEGMPRKIEGALYLSGNPLKSLVGGPEEVGEDMAVDGCGLTSLEGLPVKIGSYLMLDNNPLTSLQGINKLREMSGSIYLDDCLITSHILGVFFIKGVKQIATVNRGDFGRAVKIVNRHIKQGRSGLLPCTQELIEAGLADFAQI
jgi:hypothetical protein